MSKISIDNRRDRFTVTNYLSYPESINDRVYKAVASGMLEGFLPLTVRQKRKETIAECTVQGLMPLTQYFNCIVTKKMFLEIAHQLALLVKSCDKNMINSANIDLNRDRIFVDPQTKIVKCIFWPIVNNQLETPPHLFFMQLPHGLKFNPHEDTSYLAQYQQFFEGTAPFSVNSFERFLLKMQGKQVTGHTAPSGALSGALSGETAGKKKIPVDIGGQIEYDPFAEMDTEIREVKKEIVPPVEQHREIQGDHEQEKASNDDVFFCKFCGGQILKNANFCLHCGAQLNAPASVPDPVPEPVPDPVPEPVPEPVPDPVPEPVPESVNHAVTSGTTVLGQDQFGTTVLGYDEPQEPVMPKLSRVRSGESFEINRAIYKIGSEYQTCDLYINDNNYISRNHADIITRNDRYYIMDRKSTNKTYVDRKLIPAEVEVEIFSGTEIRLANEDFVFNIE